SPTSNASYQVGNDFSGYFGADAADIGKLYSLFYTSTLGNNLNAAGFQLALWELIADSSKNLAAGLVKKTSSTNASIVSTAQGMLDALSGPAGADSFIFTLYTSASKQDYMVATLNQNQVPEPHSVVLMGLALALLALSLRRQR
ncbi:MAG: PEP-CTERM sorting domain-containing protein, partial [Rhodocyclaceae bacterium]|nr:PEP-CTERM sorting domain-containing protein [Rhodocyclaceae bacterium]